MELLKNTLKAINGKGYKSYKQIEGRYDFNDYILYIDHISSDPFAPPSRFRASISMEMAGFPKHFWEDSINRIATEDYLTRIFAENIKKWYKYKSSIGNSGLLSIQKTGQEILKRTSFLINPKIVEVRFEIGLPAAGRFIKSNEAINIIFEILPKIINYSLYYEQIDKISLLKQNELFEDQSFLRKSLKEKGLVAFIANGAILPRESGVSDKPMQKDYKEFKSPHEYEYDFILPNRGHINGMGIRNGITLIVGGGYHGKSTLLNALELGVYNHIEGDGREYTISDIDSVKIRAEDSRNIKCVDISPFINNLPNKKNTKKFSTNNASGSTSQAANISEAIEANASVLLIDEDTSATNFMIRDLRMQKLVSKEKEPITPFVDRAREIYEKLGISSILVIGGTGDFFDIADSVIMMDEYSPIDVTEKAKKIAVDLKTTRIDKGYNIPKNFKRRIIKRSSFKSDDRGLKIRVKNKNTIQINRETLDLNYLEQIVDINQTNSIANMIKYSALNIINDKKSITEIALELRNIIDEKGLDILSEFTGHPGNMSEVRLQEFIFALNRFRGIDII